LNSFRLANNEYCLSTSRRLYIHECSSFTSKSGKYIINLKHIIRAVQIHL